MLFKWLQSELPWTLETLHCSHFCDFDASLFRVFSEVRKGIDFGALWAGGGGGGRGSSKLQILQILQNLSSTPCSPFGGAANIYMKGFAPCRRPLNSRIR